MDFSFQFYAEGPYRNMEKKVEELKKSIKNSYNLDQMVNEANVEAHYKWTGIPFENLLLLFTVCCSCGFLLSFSN